MKSRYVCTWSTNVGDINSNKAYIRVLGYLISYSGKYSGFGYPDIRIPVEITICKTYFIQMCDIRQVRQSLTDKAANALVSSHLD